MGAAVLFAGFAALFVLGGWTALGDPPKPFAKAEGFFVSGLQIQAAFIATMVAILSIIGRRRRQPGKSTPPPPLTRGVVAHGRNPLWPRRRRPAGGRRRTDAARDLALVSRELGHISFDLSEQGTLGRLGAAAAAPEPGRKPTAGAAASTGGHAAARHGL